ncbi:hypothetical protein SRABI106_04452 [Rahnella aquatilis]|nr:hypothetical protein SRABI106_04452 [Rahnella aquatilis]
MLGFVIQDFVVNFVGKNNQIMFPGDVHNLHQQFFAVYRTGRVVRVDDHNAAGAWGDFVTNIGNVREPVSPFITQVMHRITA